MRGDMMFKSDNNDYINVRKAEISDSDVISKLCGQLGYPASKEDVRNKLQEILSNYEHAVLVAEIEGAGVVGWVHAFVKHLFYVETAVEIGGLVVDENNRKKGTGKALMQGVEQWTKENGYIGVVLRSNEGRKGAHIFYKSIGYSHIKNHLTFYKEL